MNSRPVLTITRHDNGWVTANIDTGSAEFTASLSAAEFDQWQEAMGHEV